MRAALAALAFVALLGLVALSILLLSAPTPVAAEPLASKAVTTAEADELLPLDELSPGLLGMFRKVMEIEDVSCERGAT